MYYLGGQDRQAREFYPLVDVEREVQTDALYQFVGDAERCEGTENAPFEFAAVNIKCCPIEVTVAVGRPSKKTGRFTLVVSVVQLVPLNLDLL